MHAYQIRDAQPEDAAALIALRQRVFAETPFMLFGAGEYQPSTDEFAEHQRRILASGYSRSLLAHSNGALIGFLGATGSPIRRLRHSANVFLGVLRDHWGNGVATALMTEIVRWAPTAGISRLELQVMKQNTRALEVYQRMGFRVEGERRRAYIVNDEDIDDLLMAYVFEVPGSERAFTLYNGPLS